MSQAEITGTVLIFGASSPMAIYAAHGFARRGADIILVGRNRFEMQRTAADMQIRYRVKVDVVELEATNVQGFPDFLAALDAQIVSPLVGALMAWGWMPQAEDMLEASADDRHMSAVVNYLAPAEMLSLLGKRLGQQGKGFLIGISSVAGDRGRQSNYVYGAAKAGFSAFLSGLRNRLAPLGVRVITIKPGVVDTRMTQGKKGLFLVASPKDVGLAIANTLSSWRDVHYLPWFWIGIMAIIKAVPEVVFKRASL